MTALVSLGRATLAALALTTVLGLAYPLLVTGVARVAFESQAEGSLIRAEGHVVGSRLAAQSFTAPRYFLPRPSATTPPYNAAGTTFANLGPTSPELTQQIALRARTILKRERPYNPGLTIGAIPVDAVTASASGIDPDISPLYAALQAKRVAAVRHLPLARVQKLIGSETQGRSLGFFGEPGVNVLELNLALDRARR